MQHIDEVETHDISFAMMAFYCETRFVYESLQGADNIPPEVASRIEHTAKILKDFEEECEYFEDFFSVEPLFTKKSSN
jgi:hypothetical protein